jgi:hypothetical protein
MKKILSFLAVGVTLAASSASAAILTYNSELSPYDIDLRLDVQTPLKREISAISGANFLADGNYAFEGLCIEIEQDPWLTQEYTRTVLTVADSRYSNLAKLYGTWYSASKASAVGLSAFATAAREIQYDSVGSLNLSAGNFIVNAGPAEVLTLANQMVASIKAAGAPVPSGWEFFIWSNPVDQDLLDGHRVATVPVPGTLAVLLGGLFALLKVNSRAKGRQHLKYQTFADRSQ